MKLRGLWSLIIVRAAETGGRKGPVFINPAPLGKLFLFAQKQQQLKASPGLFIGDGQICLILTAAWPQASKASEVFVCL